MTDWRTHLTPDEQNRLGEIAQGILDLRREHRRVFDRARKRGKRKEGDK